MFTCCSNDSSVINLIYSGQLQFSQKNYLIADAGMSEIRDRAKAAPVKSRKFRDNGLPVSG
jgi:hypothetical protein